MSTMADLGNRLYPSLGQSAPAVLTPVSPARIAPSIITPSIDAELASRMGYRDVPMADKVEPVMMPGMAELASRMPYTSNQAPDLGDDNITDDAPVLAPVPGAVQELRDADGARRMYSPQVIYALALPDDLITDDNTPEPVRAAVVSEMREIAADVGASTQEVIKLRSVANSLTEDPSPAQRNAWHTEAVDRLNAGFGETAAQALRDAAKLVQRDQRLANVLNINGLGDHPDTILMMARLARQARLNGKLK